MQPSAAAAPWLAWGGCEFGVLLRSWGGFGGSAGKVRSTGLEQVRRSGGPRPGLSLSSVAEVLGSRGALPSFVAGCAKC